METLEIRTIFTLTVCGFRIPVTETVVVSWGVMLILIAGSVILTYRLKTIPAGAQVIVETAVEFLNNFTKQYLGVFARYLAPYFGTLFLFLFLASIIGIISPINWEIGGREFIRPFHIRTPVSDINVTAAFAAISILLILVCGFAARGFKGWFKHLLYPVPMMLPFNIMEYGTRLISLSLRLFGNILGGYVMMNMIERAIPVAIPAICALYFDFFDGLLQAVIFVFLTTLYISEAVTIHEEQA